VSCETSGDRGTDTRQPIQKRRIALLRSMDKIPEAITQLVNLLDYSPTDAEAWAELSDLYLSQSLFDQAIFCLEEVLLLNPNAWNVRE
jgi:ER membrane protein complex subunit 2